MQLSITGRGIDLTPAIEEYVNKKIGGLDKFYDRIVRGHVAVGIESVHQTGGKRFFAECKLEVPGNDIFVEEQHEDMYAAIDILRDRLEKLVIDHKQSFDLNSQDRIAQRDAKGYKEE